ncbi:MAG: dockerin type I domain-containing protein [Polyangiaceae bacterium]
MTNPSSQSHSHNLSSRGRAPRFAAQLALVMSLFASVACSAFTVAGPLPPVDSTGDDGDATADPEGASTTSTASSSHDDADSSFSTTGAMGGTDAAGGAGGSGGSGSSAYGGQGGSPTCNFTYGDANDDGDVNVSDWHCIIGMVNGNPPSSCLPCIEAHDMNCDGQVNNVDSDLSSSLVLAILEGQPSFGQGVDNNSNLIHDDCE